MIETIKMNASVFFELTEKGLEMVAHHLKQLYNKEDVQAELETYLANHRALMSDPNYRGRKMYRLELFAFMHIFGQQLTWGAEAVTVGNVIYYDNGREDHTPWITNQG